MSGEFFACSLSKTQRFKSMLPWAFLLLMAGVIIVVIPAGSRNYAIPLVSGIFLLASVPFVILWRSAPKGYWVTPDGLSVVRRNGKKLSFSKSELVSVKACEADVLNGLTRDWAGTGSYFGDWGDFSCPALGKFRGYWTNPSLVVIQTTRKDYYEHTLVLSPDERERFLLCMQGLLGEMPS